MSAVKGPPCASNLSLYVKSCTYTWTIDNYSVLSATLENFRSPTFSAAGDDFKWYLEHKISWIPTEYHVSFILLPASDDDFEKYSPVSGNLKASVRYYNTKARVYNTTEKEGSFKIFYDGSSSSRRRFELPFCTLATCKDTLAKYDKLQVVYDLKYLKTNDITSHNSTFSDTNPFKTTQCSLSRDLERFRTDEDFTDVTISVKDKNYPVHKAILAARSSVFRAMFKSNMQESQNNHIAITDMDQDVFEEMLYYIYTGMPQNLEEFAFELLPVADKYDLKDLKTMCEEVLYKKLAPDNALKILILADMHRAKELKTLAIRYIKRNAANGEDFKSDEILEVLKTSHPELMADMLAEFLKKE